MKSILPLLSAFMAFLLISNQAIAETKHDISIIKFKFSPAEIAIQAGDTIRWTNREKRQYHSVWFEKLGEPEPDYLFPDEFYERTFKETGDFPYRCGPHPEMTGIVHVSASADASTAKENSSSQLKTDATDGSRSKTEKSAPETTRVTADSDENSESTDPHPIPAERQKEIIHILKQDCGSCHGMTLKGGLGSALTPEALEKLTAEQIAMIITHGRPNTPMPPWKPFFNMSETKWLAEQLKKGIETTTPEQTASPKQETN